MNLLSFVDELVKVGAMGCLYKRADDGEINASEIPHGMMSPGVTPPSILLNPALAGTRLPLTAASPISVEPGQLGALATTREPIDREKFNRAYKDRR
jgi:hypothetical protein